MGFYFWSSFIGGYIRIMVMMSPQQAADEFSNCINKLAADNVKLKNDINTIASCISDLNKNMLKLEKRVSVKKPIILNTKVDLEELN